MFFELVPNESLVCQTHRLGINDQNIEHRFGSYSGFFLCNAIFKFARDTLGASAG